MAKHNKMQTATTAKKSRKGLPANSILQPEFSKDEENSSLDYFLDSSTFNQKYECDAIEYVLSMRMKKGLDTVPKQNPVLAIPQSLENSQFIYCLRLDQVRKCVDFDPYTLVMVSPSKVKSFAVYFTASTWTITEVQYYYYNLNKNMCYLQKYVVILHCLCSLSPRN